MLDALASISSGFETGSTVDPRLGVSRNDTFADALAQRTSRLTATNATDAGQTKQEQLRGAAGQLVATAFLLPFMEQARDSGFKSDLFGGGFAQDAMRQKLDVELADRLANSDAFPLVDALVDRLDRTA